MSKNKGLFSKSIAADKKVGLFKGIAQNKITGSGFVNSTKHLETTIEFYSEDVKKSKKLDEQKFTNFLHKNTQAEIKTRIYELVQDPSIVDNNKVGEVRLNEKIIRCIELYVNQLPEHPLVVKSDLSDTFGIQLGVRVYSIFELPNDDPNMKAVYKIALIDPFHLVIPSAHAGKSSDIMERETYKNNKNNSQCMSDWLKEQSAF